MSIKHLSNLFRAGEYREIIGCYIVAPLFFAPAYIIGLGLHHLIWYSENKKNAQIKQDRFNNLPEYIHPDINDIYYYGLKIDENYNDYKTFIYDQYMNKCYLMVNKNTAKLAYVLNQNIICDDIEKYKIKKELNTSA